jgi:hypothetical protein
VVWATVGTIVFRCLTTSATITNPGFNLDHGFNIRARNKLKAA